MTDINLLPWREQLREELQREFLVILGTALAAAALVVILMHVYFSTSISNQKNRNAILQAEIKTLNIRIKKIKTLQKEKEQLVGRMTVIQELQTNRPLTVHLFDSMVNIIPDGIFVKSISRKGKNMNISGYAESNTQVSSLMRRIDNDDWVESSRLKEIKGKSSKNIASKSMKDFVLKLKIKNPIKEKKEG